MPNESTLRATLRESWERRSDLFPLRVRLTTAYTHATLGEKVMSLVTKLEFCRVVFGRLDKSLANKVIQNSPFVRLQIGAGSLK